MFIKVYLRNIGKRLPFFLINVLGLSMALGFFILVFFFLKNELGHDRFHDDAGRIYRTSVFMGFRGGMISEGTPFRLAESIESEIGGVEMTSHLIDLGSVEIELENNPSSSRILMASESFFEMFNFPSREGDAQESILDPNSIIISSSERDKYFKGQEAIGQLITIKFSTTNEKIYKIGAVVTDPPENSSIQFDMVISSANYRVIHPEQIINSWMPVKSDVLTFAKLAPETSKAQLVTGLNSIAESHNMDKRLNSVEEKEKFPIMRLVDVYYNNNADIAILKAKGIIKYVYVLGTVAALVLLIAIINFANLSVGLALSRAKEIGVRKVLGVTRKRLRRQFMLESLITVMIGLIGGLILAILSLNFFNQLVSKNLSIDFISSPESLIMIVAIGLLAAILAGAYPALTMSSFKATKALKGKVSLKSNWLPKTMTVIQFGISMILILAALTMKSQLNYLLKHDLKFEKQNLVYLTFDAVSIRDSPQDEDVQLFREEASKYTQIKGVSSARGGLFDHEAETIWSIEKDGEQLTIPSIKIDYRFLDVLGIDLLAGRNFDASNPSDGNAILVNQAFLDKLGIEDAVGKPAPLGQPNNPLIIGVVDNFRFKSLRSAVSPVILNLRPGSPNSSIIVRLGDDIREGIDQIEAAWEKGGKASIPFEYEIFEDQLASQYSTEEEFRAVINFATIFAVTIALMGLVGLTALSVSKRTKEMSLRMVVGARLADVLLLFIKDGTKMVILSNLIFWPLAYLYLENWLNDYTVRLVQSWQVYVGLGLLVIAITCVIITFQVWRTSNINPVENLRNE